ncbi:MAG: hypothetical protein HFH73_03105 [Lachnospiraceae bacterium]|jgi:hypothetical protein|nr:hypothetical protein [Lachnospiraceae bacterium]
MQEYREPLFCKGRVLKKESLEALRDFPGSLAELGYAGWSDGILFGFDISFEDGWLTIGKGAVWQDGQVILAQQQSIPFHAYNEPVVVQFRLYPAASTDDFNIRPYEICIEIGEAEATGLELARFRLSEGARLRKEYRNLQDFGTAYNTLDITRVPYAGPGGVTVSPVLLRAFAHAIMENGAQQDMDIPFVFLCLNHPPVSRECLLWYLSRRLRVPYRELGHREIYERLIQIAGHGSCQTEQKRKNLGPSVI